MFQVLGDDPTGARGLNAVSGEPNDPRSLGRERQLEP